MIGWLQGKIIDKQPPGTLLIEVNSIGYEVETSAGNFLQLELNNELVKLYIHTLVREDILQLFGFLHKSEKALFQALIKANGVGPKLAIAILSNATPERFIQSIQQQDMVFLVKLPGIGKKTAERLVIEMKDSLKHFNLLQPTCTNTQGVALNKEVSNYADAVSALESLGYKQQDAAQVVSKIYDGQQDIELLIKQALQLLRQSRV